MNEQPFTTCKVSGMALALILTAAAVAPGAAEAQVDEALLGWEDETLDETAIHLLTSKDGLKWTMKGNVLQRRQDSGWENEGVGTPVVWREGTRWYMLYEAGGPGDIGLAVSKDGKAWTRNENNKPLHGAQTELNKPRSHGPARARARAASRNCDGFRRGDGQ